MTPSWTSPVTLIGLGAALAFAVLAYHNVRRALVVVTGAGALQHLQIGYSPVSRWCRGCCQSKCWQPRWPLNETLERIVRWHKAYVSGADARELCLAEVAEFAATQFADQDT